MAKKKREKLKLLIIDPLGKETFYYLEDINTWPMERRKALFKASSLDFKKMNMEEVDQLKHSGFILDFVSHNPQLKKLSKKSGYMDILKKLENLNYLVFLDTTNYQNYHGEKEHDGLIILPLECNLLQMRSLLSHDSLFEKNYLFIRVGYLTSYPPDTPFKQVEYYPELKEILLQILAPETYEKPASEKSL